MTERVCDACGAVAPATARFCAACGARLDPTPHATEARKLVTVLFCDLVGSTALGERLDPEVFRQVQLRYFAAAEAALTRHLGVVEKFIGDAVLCVFGIPSSREDDALRACRGALDLVTAIETLNDELEPEWGIRLAVRIGVDSGVVAVGELSHGEVAVSGDAVNTAARLEQAAGPGEVLIGRTTRSLTGDDATCVPVTPLELKGKGEPVPAWRLVAADIHLGAVTRVWDAPFVDRKEELGRIGSWIDDSAATGGVGLIVGEPGIGKSRLLAAAVERAGRSALWGRCPPYGEGVAYAPLAGWLDAVGVESVERLLGATGSEPLRFAVGASDRPATAAAIADAARALVAGLARAGPVILVVEDIHDAEPAMLALLSSLVGPGVLAIGAGRPGSHAEQPPLAPGTAALRVDLQPLPPEAAARLLDSIAPSLGDSERRQVLDHAAGNPFAIGQLSRHIAEGGSTAELPVGLDALLQARVEGLSREERSVAERGAVMGREFWDAGVAALAPDAPASDAALTLLVGRSFVAAGRADGIPDVAAPTLSRVFSESARPYTFTSSLLRDAVYRATPKLRRADLHERLARLLDGDGAADELVAFHLEQAAHLRAELRPQDAKTPAARGAAHLERAGQRALARDDPNAARTFLTRAANLLAEGSPERRRVDQSLARIDRVGSGRDLVAGDVIAGYRVRAVAGRGGMGVVYRADDLALGRLVALKVISPALADDVRFRERFVRESRIAAGLEHPNVVPVYGAGEENGQLFIAMRFVDGTDLEALLRDGALEPGRAAGLVAQVGEALDAAHARGLVHRDVKPANVLVADVGGVEQAYLTDFGLTRDAARGDGLTKTGQWVGTIAYVAPEQIRGEPVDARADIYALGAVLYQCLTGARPFPVQSELEALAAHLDEPPPRPSRSGAPRAFDGIVERALSKDPGRRFRSAGDLGRAAVAAAEGGKARLAERSVGVGEAAPVQTGRRRHGRTRRTTLLVGLGAAAAVVAVALGAVVAIGALSGAGGAPANPAGKVVGTPVDLPYDPDVLAAGEGRVWSLSKLGNHLVRLTVATGQIDEFEAGVDLGGGTFADLAVGPNAVWVAHSVAVVGGVDHLEARTGEVVQHVPFPQATSVDVGGGRVWSVAPGTSATRRGNLLGIDPAGDRAIGPPTATGRDPAAVAVTGGSVWVANRGDDTVSRIDAATRTVKASIPVGDQPALLSAGGGSVWVANLGDNTLMRIDATTGAVRGAPISLGKEIDDLVVSEHAVWVAAADGTVTRLDPDSGEVVGSPLAPAHAPLSLALDGGTLWVGSVVDRTLNRIEEGGG